MAETDLSASLAEMSVDEVSAKHRRERKELQAKIQELKKNAPKSDKKKRKEVMEQITTLEAELEKRQAVELQAVKQQEQTKHSTEEAATAAAAENGNHVVEKLDPAKNGDAAPAAAQQSRISKAQKRRDKKTQEDRQRRIEIEAAAEEAKFMPKAVEAKTIQTKLAERNLAIFQIPSDGNCLYNAVRHQLEQHIGLKLSAQELRKEAANYIRANKESLICFMMNPKTGDILNDEQFEKYCKDLEMKPTWGGHVELKALSTVLKMPIEVLQAEGPPTVQGADEFDGPNLIITYHRHMLSLGEHYNSTVPIEETADDEYDA